MPGIGSLQIEKRPSVYDKETQKMTAPVYEVKYRQVGGSIDDSFANFIANNERISIAHAANHLKDFCARAKIDLREGREVVIPGIGKFTGGPNDAIGFVTDPHLHIEGKPIPFFRNNTAAVHAKEETISTIIERTNIREPKSDDEIEYKAPSVNWGKIALLIAIVLVLVGAVVLGIWYVGKNKSAEQPAPLPDTAVSQAPVTSVPDTPRAQPVVLTPEGTLSYLVALQQYATRDKAETRVARLQSYGNTVELYVKDSSSFYVVMPITSAAADTVRVVDSLKRLFNPGGNVQIIHE